MRKVLDAEKMQKAEQEILLKALGSKEGRLLLYGIIRRGGLVPSAMCVPSDPYQAQRAAGRLDLAVELLQAVLTADQNSYILMQQDFKAFEAQFMTTVEEEEYE